MKYIKFYYTIFIKYSQRNINQKKRKGQEAEIDPILQNDIKNIKGLFHVVVGIGKYVFFICLI